MYELLAQQLSQNLKVFHAEWSLNTTGCLEFHDITEPVNHLIAESGIHQGIVNIQTLHTTTALIVNEAEPLLLTDMKRILEKLAPLASSYAHDNFQIRTVNMTQEERQNGHAHCKSIFLQLSALLNIQQGQLHLGRWQRVFFLELDCARPRTVSLLAIGAAGGLK